MAVSKPKPVSRINLPRLHPGQQKIADEARKRNVIACGRRFGKSSFCEDRVIHPAIKGLPVGWFSYSYRTLVPSWEHMKTILASVIVTKNEQEKRLTLVGGGSLEFWSLDEPDSGRGRAYAVIVVDEAAYVPDLLEVWDKNLQWQLLDYDGTAWFLSTPRGIDNDFKTLYDRGGDERYPEWMSWSMPTMENPFISNELIEQMRRDTPDLAYQQEILARFITWRGETFGKIMEAVGRDIPLSGETIVGVDWAGVGQRGDFNVFMAADTGGTVLEIKRFRAETYEQQRFELKEFVAKWNPVRTVAEENSMGAPQIEQIRKDGLQIEAWVTGYANKQLIVQSLALMFEKETISIKKDIDNLMVLVGELQAFAPKKTPTGLMTYAAKNGHDDTVMALLVIAQYFANRYQGQLGYVDYLKSLQSGLKSGEMVMNKYGVATPAMCKPATSNETPRCPKCQSICIQSMGRNERRCGMCAHQWSDVPPEKLVYKGVTLAEQWANQRRLVN